MLKQNQGNYYNNDNSITLIVILILRSEISQLLEYIGIEVPKFAPISVLSSLLADSIMTEKVIIEGMSLLQCFHLLL